MSIDLIDYAKTGLACATLGAGVGLITGAGSAAILNVSVILGVAGIAVHALERFSASVRPTSLLKVAAAATLVGAANFGIIAGALSAANIAYGLFSPLAMGVINLGVGAIQFSHFVFKVGCAELEIAVKP